LSPRGHTVGVFDSGVGGLSVLRALLAELPDTRFVYVADSAYAPYGERSAEEVTERSQRITAASEHRAMNQRRHIVRRHTAVTKEMVDARIDRDNAIERAGGSICIKLEQNLRRHVLDS
jgi:glutamate racemase